MARDELEETAARVDAAQDSMATDMFTLVTREAEIAHTLLRYVKLQRAYHEATFMLLSSLVPEIERFIRKSLKTNPIFLLIYYFKYF